MLVSRSVFYVLLALQSIVCLLIKSVHFRTWIVFSLLTAYLRGGSRSFPRRGTPLRNGTTDWWGKRRRRLHLRGRGAHSRHPPPGSCPSCKPRQNTYHASLKITYNLYLTYYSSLFFFTTSFYFWQRTCSTLPCIPLTWSWQERHRECISTFTGCFMAWKKAQQNYISPITTTRNFQGDGEI